MGRLRNVFRGLARLSLLLGLAAVAGTAQAQSAGDTTLSPAAANQVTHWRDATAAALRVEWPGANHRPSDRVMRRLHRDKAIEPYRPIFGLWLATPGHDQHLLELRLRNDGSQTLPWIGLRLKLGAPEAQAVFDCELDLPPQAHAPAELLNLAPLESRAVLCTALGGPDLRQQLPANVEQARAGSVPLQWLAPALDTPETRQAFEQWIAARAAAVRHEAATRQQALEADLARQQAAALTPARPSAGSRWQARLEQRWTTLRNDATTGWRRWSPELMMLGTTLLLFGFGRLLRRAGCPMPLMLGASVVLTGVLAFAVMKWIAGPNPTAGEGWQRGSVAAFGVMVASIYVLGGLLALHALHVLLDDDKVSWLDTVIRGWRGVTNWSGPASRGEFWGFVAHVALLWAGARVALHPAEQVVALVAGPALGALLWRRMWTMSWAEKGAVAASLGLVILEILLGALL